MSAVGLERVVIERGGFRLTADCTFGPGLHVVVGRIGSGKSTLALALAGGLQPSSGTVRFEGISRHLWVGQSPGHHLTGETVTAEVESWGLEPGQLLPRIGLAGRDTIDPFHLSRGEQQRLVIGCALATDADLLVLDEPFAPLDVPGRIGLARALANRPGITIATTHTDRYLPSTGLRWRIRDGRVEREDA